MRTKGNKVYLSKAEQAVLKKLTRTGTGSAQIITRAHILLSLDENSGKVKTQEEIAEAYGCNPALVRTIAKQYTEGGIEKVITRKKRQTPPVPSKITGDIEAKIIQLACSKPPEGHTRWTLCLLEDKVVELGIIDSISDNTIGRLLKKRRSSLIRKRNGAYLPNKTRRS